MLNYDSKVTITLVLKNVPVTTDSHPNDITVANWKNILMDNMEVHINQWGLLSMATIKKYSIEKTKRRKS